MTTKTYEVLDQEWIILIKEAKQLGLSVKDVKDYLNLHSIKQS
ncbi:anti-repressor SinI family protein [Bacillus alkalicellulosilyticus]|nr:anti-repressor SinI family protein [Bacillus alkalicellulosilyticus]